MLGNENKICIGVDNFSDPIGSLSRSFYGFWERMKTFNQKSKFYEMDYVKYLENVHREKIGVYSREDQYNALVMAEKFFALGCVIIIDDTNIEPIRTSTEQFIKEREDLYETLFIANTCFNGHPTWWDGIFIFRKKG